MTDPSEMKRSAEPEYRVIEDDKVYEVQHAIAVSGKWSEQSVVFRFERRRRHFRVLLQRVGHSAHA